MNSFKFIIFKIALLFSVIFLIPENNIAQSLTEQESQAESYTSAGKYSDAISLYQKISKQYQASGNSGKAIDALKKAKNVAKTNNLSYKLFATNSMLGALYGRNKQYGAAQLVLEENLAMIRRGSFTKYTNAVLLELSKVSRLNKDYTKCGAYLSELKDNVYVNNYNEAMLLKCYNEYVLYYQATGNTAKHAEYFEKIENIKLDNTTQEMNARTNSAEEVMREAVEVIQDQESKLNQASDSLNSANESIKEKEVELEAKEEVIKLKDDQIAYQNKINILLFSIIILVLMFSIILFFLLRKIKLTNNELKDKNYQINQQKEEITAQNDELQETNDLLEFEKKQTQSSLRYAQTIQQATLPTQGQLADGLDLFVFFSPRDIVSGDFYWHAKLINYKNSKPMYLLAIADSTGHGVPGAFMSMIGNRLLNQIVIQKSIFDPAEILEQLHIEIRKALNQEHSENNDGMDVCLCRFDLTENDDTKITFAGAKRPLLHYSTKDKAVNRIKGSRKTIGGRMRIKGLEKQKFENFTLLPKKGDMVYLTTDGFVDQHDIKRKKFGHARFSKLIAKNAEAPLDEQKDAFEIALDTHKAHENQRDDIAMIGIRI